MPERIPKAVVVGSSYVDMAVKCSQIPSGGQNFPGVVLSYTVTGPGPNEAVEAALCGCDVRLISKVGGDPFGQTVKASLAEFGVNTDFVYTAEAKNTGVIISLVGATGENAYITYTGANSALGVQDIEAAERIIAEADVCLIHGRLPQEAISKTIRCAKLHGKKVILNPARPIDQSKKDRALPAEYFSASVLIPNLYEAADITDQSAANIRTAKLIGSDLVARGVNAAVITMGKRGCVVVDRKGTDHIPAFQVELVDHTCTGDAFAGALAACYAVETDIRVAVKFASAAGALACTRFSSIESLPTKEEIIELLQKEDLA